jgi:hypothetical protein
VLSTPPLAPFDASRATLLPAINEYGVSDST